MDGRAPGRSVPRRHATRARSRSTPSSRPIRSACSARRSCGASVRGCRSCLKVLAADEPLSIQAHPDGRAGARGLRARGRGRHPARRATALLPRCRREARADLRADPVPRADPLPRARRASPRASRALEAPELGELLRAALGRRAGRRAARALRRLDAPRPGAPAPGADAGGERARRSTTIRTSRGSRAWPPTSRRTSARSRRCCSTWSSSRPARRCSCRPASCTPISRASASRSWPAPTTCCAAGSRRST